MKASAHDADRASTRNAEKVTKIRGHFRGMGCNPALSRCNPVGAPAQLLRTVWEAKILVHARRVPLEPRAPGPFSKRAVPLIPTTDIAIRRREVAPSVST